MRGDSANSPFNSYDREVVRGIQARWYELLEGSERMLKADANGIVVVQFHMLPDGRIEDFQVIKSDVDKMHTLLCRKAIHDLAPFPRWPDAMIQMVTAPYREIRFTFYYE